METAEPVGPLVEHPDLPVSTAADLEHQLDRFASDVGELYKRQKERAEELEAAIGQLRTSYLETVRPDSVEAPTTP